jgi:hypothetical protein
VSAYSSITKRPNGRPSRVRSKNTPIHTHTTQTDRGVERALISLGGVQLLSVAVEARTWIGFALVSEARHIVRHGGAVQRRWEERRMCSSCDRTRVGDCKQPSGRRSNGEISRRQAKRTEGQEAPQKARQRGQRRWKWGRRTGENGRDAGLLMVTLAPARCAPLCLRPSLATGHRLALQPQRAESVSSAAQASASSWLNTDDLCVCARRCIGHPLTGLACPSDSLIAWLVERRRRCLGTVGTVRTPCVGMDTAELSR